MKLYVVVACKNKTAMTVDVYKTSNEAQDAVKNLVKTRLTDMSKIEYYETYQSFAEILYVDNTYEYFKILETDAEI